MPQDLLEQLAEWVRCRHFGKYRGIVVDNDDKTGRGRLKVRVRSVLGSLEVWAMPCVPYAGAGVGFYSLPPKDAGVWVEFEGGDPSYPIWTGCFWADQELPDESNAALKIWKTDSLTIRIDDDADEIVIEATNGAKLTITTDVITEAGEATLTVGSNGVVSEQGASKAEVTSAAFKVNNGALEVV
ncbi:MAG TPA: phage baseplate assembly protein V [Thermomicrobiales bacterium]|nr:phage baseplate assembly protein V [Thermomicrobiales bacterium]